MAATPDIYCTDDSTMGRSLDDYSKAMASPGTLCRSTR